MQAAAKFWSRLWLRLRAPGSAAFSVPWPPPAPPPKLPVPARSWKPGTEEERSAAAAAAAAVAATGRSARAGPGARGDCRGSESGAGEGWESEGGAGWRARRRGAWKLDTARPRRPACSACWALGLQWVRGWMRLGAGAPRFLIAPRRPFWTARSNGHGEP